MGFQQHMHGVSVLRQEEYRLTSNNTSRSHHSPTPNNALFSERNSQALSASTIVKSQNGLGIVSVLIAISLMGIISLAFASIMSAQFRQTKGLQEKLAAIDFQQQLTRSFIDGTLCTKIMAPPSSPPVTFTVPSGGATTANPVSQSLSITSVPTSTASSAPTLVSSTSPPTPVSAIASSLVPASVNPFQLTNIVGTSNGTVGTFSANFTVNFEGTKLVLPLKPAVTQINLQTSGGVTGTQTITGCMENTTSPSGKTLIVVDEKPSGTQSGACSPGLWKTRDLNTTHGNTIVGASRSGNQIILPAGTYTVRSSVPAYALAQNKAKFFNVTDNLDVIIGASAYAQPGFQATSYSMIVGQFSISATKSFEIRHYCPGAAAGADAFGLPTSVGVPEVYTQVEIIQN